MPLTNFDVLKLTIKKAIDESDTDPALKIAAEIVETFGWELGKNPIADRPFIQRVKSYQRAPKEVESLPLPLGDEAPRSVGGRMKAHAEAQNALLWCHDCGFKQGHGHALGCSHV